MKTRAIFLFEALAFCALMALGLSTAPAPIFAQPDRGVPERLIGVETADGALESDKAEVHDQRTAPQGTEIGTNTLYGENAGKSITTGLSNTFIGSEAGYSNQAGWANTFVGRDAGYHTTSGGNTFIGYYAGYLNTGAEGNTFVGLNAGKNNTSSYNHFFGTEAGVSNTTGNCNSFFGWEVGLSNTEGSANSFFGWRAGHSNIDGNSNSFFGYDAGEKNITGHDNSFFGRAAGDENTHGYYNSFFGNGAGGDNTIGNQNSFFGVSAGADNVNGSNNTFIGNSAGSLNIAGNRNVFLGNEAGFYETSSDKLYIDNSGTNNPLIWGDFGTRKVVINGGFRAVATSSSSDGRWKKNIEPLASSLDKISRLHGVSYEWKTDTYPDFGLTEGKQIGLVAQDVEKVLPELVSEDKDGYKSVSYTKLTAVLVEAVKELKAENLRQKELLEKQQTDIEALRLIIKESKS